VRISGFSQNTAEQGWQMISPSVVRGRKALFVIKIWIQNYLEAIFYDQMGRLARLAIDMIGWQ
jgi:hypothetical protein